MRPVMRVVDLFAGPGGWDQGLVDLGFGGTVVGIEWDTAACQTAKAAGHLRIQADVAAYPPEPFTGWEGLIASPPCQAFSLAGKGAGLGVVDKLLDHVWTCKDGWVDPPADICIDDVRADLTLQPLRWADALHPDWIALEQVPGVLPLWRAMAAVFERWGYSTAVAKLNAADYGIPQTRKRAVLVASRTVAAQMPDPTHFDPLKGGSLFGMPWVSMAEGLGWPDDYELDRRTNSRAAGGGVEPTATVSTDRPAPTFTGKSGTQWIARPAGWGFTERPAPTVCAGPNGKYTGAEWGGSAIRETMKRAIGTPEWALKNPSPTVTGGGAATGGAEVFANAAQRARIDNIRVSVEEAGVLQSFPRNYPWQGTKTKKYEQVGNAIPPRLAAVVLAPLVADHCAAAAA